METIKLDLIPGKKMPSLHASQYDKGRDYHIDLTENRVPYVLDGTETISLTVRKCDNTLVTMDIANTFADKSYIEFRTTEQMNACAGFNYGEITIEKNGTQISSLNFYLQVEGAPDEGGITSQSEINNLNSQITEEVDRILPDMVDEVAEPIINEKVPEKVAELVPSAVATAAGEIVPPLVNELVPQAIGNNYYNKTQTDTKIEELIDDEHTTNNKTWSGQKINNAILDVMPQSSASGSVASFDTSLDFPLISLTAEIKCTKVGNVISGYNNVILKHYADDISDADTITIPLLSDEYDGELIITDKGNGFASVKKIINGKRYDLSTWTWHLHTNGFYYATKPAEMAICASDVKPDILAEKYDIQTGQWIYSHGSSYGYLGQNGGAIWITDSTTPSGHIVAPLTEPIVTDLPDIPSIFAFSGENNISANSGGVSVSFRLSLTDAIDEKADKSNTYTKEEVDELITRVGDKGLYVQAKKNVMSSPQTFPPKIDNKKNAVLEFLGYFSTFTSLTFGHGYGSISGSYVVIDDTYLTVYYSAPAQQRDRVEHGLSISGFIHVAINQLNNAHANIQITTTSGTYELSNTTWVGCQGSVYANVGSEMTDVCVTSVYKDLNEKLFLYGDSYVSLDDPARYTYYLVKNGYTHFFLDGWAGRASGDALASFKATIPYVTPDYAVWGMGMNNPDVGEINPNWLRDTQEFLSICEEKDITPILTVTPCTPTVDNTYKNAWVKASGYRYVDFAKSVGAESAGSSWYAGMLYTDNVHPTSLGAKALYARLISDVPEFIK